MNIEEFNVSGVPFKKGPKFWCSIFLIAKMFNLSN